MYSRFSIMSCRVVCFCFLLTFLSWGIASPAASQAPPSKPADKLSQVDIVGALTGGNPAFDHLVVLGFTDRNKLLVLLNRNPLSGQARFFWIDAKKGQVSGSAPGGLLDPFGPHLSPDGKTVIGYDNVSLHQRQFPNEPCLHYLRVFNSATMMPAATIDIGRMNNIHGVTFVPNEPGKVVIWATTLEPYDGDTALLNDHFEFWNWKQAQRLGRINYKSARSTGDVIFSPKPGMIACVNENDESYGEGGMTVLDRKTGDFLWHSGGQSNFPVGPPFVFLSNTEVISKEHIYNIQTHKITPLLPQHPKLRSVSGIPGYPSLMFMQAETGLQLWDIRTRKSIKQWPQIKNSGAVYLSPNFALMAVVTSPGAGKTEVANYRKAAVEFWKFAPRLLGKIGK